MSDLQQEILEIIALRNREEYFVPEWNKTVFLQELSGKQLLEFFKSCEVVDGETVKNPIDAMVTALSYALVDKDGKPLLTKTQLKSVGGMVLLKMGAKALLMSGLSNPEALLEATEELKKAPTGDLPSD